VSGCLPPILSKTLTPQPTTLDLMNHLKSFIAGKWVEGSGDSIESTCPATGTVVAAGHCADLSQVDQAFAAARDAFGPWWDLGAQARLDMAKAFAEHVQRQPSLARSPFRSTRWLPDAARRHSKSALQRQSLVSNHTGSVECWGRSTSQLTCPTATSFRR